MSVPRIVQIVFVVFLILTILLKWGFILNLIAAVGAIGAAFYARSAQTPGYKLAGLYLIDVRSGRKVSFFRALARFACFVFAGFSIIGLLICFFRKDRLNLHDLLSGTAPVVRKDAQ